MTETSPSCKRMILLLLGETKTKTKSIVLIKFSEFVPWSEMVPSRGVNVQKRRMRLRSDHIPTNLQMISSQATSSTSAFQTQFEYQLKPQTRNFWKKLFDIYISCYFYHLIPNQG